MKLTKKQNEANELLAGPACHVMLFGGSRSGKTFVLVRAVCVRAIKAPKSRHAIVRFRFNAVKNSIVLDTFPKVMSLCFPEVKYTLNKSDWYVTLENGSEIWFAGLDDKERTEKILGMEFATIYPNECSQIPYSSIETAITRLAQKAEQQSIGDLPACQLRPRVYYDCVSGKTILDGQTKTIKELAEIGMPIKALTSHGFRYSSAPWCNGVSDMLQFVTSTGRTIEVTKSHRFWVKDEGWVKADKVTNGHSLLCTDVSQFHDDEPDAKKQIETTQDSMVNCCKYPHQYDEQSLHVQDCDLSYPASSCDVVEHSLSTFHHDLLDCHTRHHDRQEVQHIHHSLMFHALLLQWFASMLVYIQFRFVSGTFLLFQQIRQHLSQSLELFYLHLPIELRFSSRHSSLLNYLVYLLPIHSYCEPYTQSQQNSQKELQYQHLNGRLSGEKVFENHQSFSFDTPIESNGYYEVVESIIQKPADYCYTIEVPSCHHYVSNGFVSHNCNPPSKAHWSYKLFKEKRDPDTKEALSKPDNYTSMQMNPIDNVENLAEGYMETLDAMSSRARKRFRDGEFADATPNQLFPEEFIDRWRVIDGILPDMVRVVVAVDPSGADDADNADNDAIGIVVAGLGTDGNAYLGPDLTVKAGPGTWGKVATDAYDRHEADVVVGETNYGGAMVKYVIQTCRPRTNFSMVTASRGKTQRAEPFSALYEQGKVRHVGYLTELEDELAGFSTYGYTGERSPNRADAAIWALAALFPAIVKPKAEQKKLEPKPFNGNRSTGWMGA